MLIRSLLLLSCLFLLSCAPYTRSSDVQRSPASRPGMKGRKDLLQAVEKERMDRALV